MTTTLLIAAIVMLFAGLFLIGWGLSGKKKPTFTRKDLERCL